MNNAKQSKTRFWFALTWTLTAYISVVLYLLAVPPPQPLKGEPTPVISELELNLSAHSAPKTPLKNTLPRDSIEPETRVVPAVKMQPRESEIRQKSVPEKSVAELIVPQPLQVKKHTVDASPLTSESDDAVDLYLLKLRQHFAKYASATQFKSTHTGSAEVSLTINSQGKITRAERTSGNARVAEEAIRLFRAAQPLPVRAEAGDIKVFVPVRF